MPSTRALLTTLPLSCFLLAAGCATQQGDDANIEISLGGGKADEFGSKTLSLMLGEQLDSSVGETTSAEVTVRFRADDKLAVRADLVAFGSLLAWDDTTQESLSDYIVTFEAQAKSSTVTLGFVLIPFDPEDDVLEAPIALDGVNLFEHVAFDFGTKEITKDGERTYSFDEAGLSTHFAYASVAVVAVPLATSDVP